MALKDPDATVKVILAAICIVALLLIGALFGAVNVQDGLITLVLALLGGLLVSKVGHAAGFVRSRIGPTLTFNDPDNTLKAVVGMILLTIVGIVLLYLGIDPISLKGIIVLIAALAGYYQGEAIGYVRGYNEMMLHYPSLVQMENPES